MSFLNPVMLWGLLAVSIPILIHLFNLRKTKKIEFSTLIFLQEIQQTKYKRIKLLQILILLCRIGFIIFLVMAFAKPVTKGYPLSGATGQKSSVLLILDDSYSMQIRNENGSYFENAKRELTSLAEMISKDSEIFYTTVSAIRDSERNFLYNDITSLKDSVEKSGISYIRRDLQEINYFSSKILNNSSYQTKEIFLFTDGQRNVFENIRMGTNENLSVANFNIVLTGNRTGNNLVLDSVDIKTKIFEPGKEIRLSAVVHNSNTFDVSAKNILLNLNNSQSIDEKVVDIPAGSSVEIEFNITPSAEGFSEGYVELVDTDRNDDEITFDNKRYFTFFIPEKIKLLTLSSSEEDMRFINLVLQSVSDLYSPTNIGNKNYFEVTNLFNNIGSTSLRSFDCIIINNIRNISEQESSKLSEYINEGGGLIIYPGLNASYEDYNKTFFSKLNNVHYNSIFGNLNGSEIYKFESIDYNSPLIQNIFKNAPSLETILENSPQIKFGFDIVTGLNSYSVIRLNNQKNFLTEAKTGKGRMMLYAVSPDMIFSNFPESNLFAPLTIRSILYVSKNPEMKEAICGKDYFIELTDEQDYTLTLKSISEQKKINGADDNLPVFINLRSELNTTGTYSILQNDTTRIIFPCNFDNIESDISKLTADEIKNLLREKYLLNANVITSDEPFEKSIRDFREGSELWRYFLIIALLFLIAEYILSKYLMKKPASRNK